MSMVVGKRIEVFVHNVLGDLFPSQIDGMQHKKLEQLVLLCRQPDDTFATIAVWSKPGSTAGPRPSHKS